MATFGSNDQSTVGYFLPEDSQFRLKKLREYVEFLSHLAQPRTANEDDECMPDIRAGEVAICLELLAEQVELVLDEVSFPAERKARKPKPVAGTGAEDVSDTEDEETNADAEEGHIDEAGEHDRRMHTGGDLRFGMTLAQLDAINRLVEMIRAHGDVASSSADADFSRDTLALVGHAIFDSAEALYTLMLQIELQMLESSNSPARVREAGAFYGVGAAHTLPKQIVAERQTVHLH